MREYACPLCVKVFLGLVLVRPLIQKSLKKVPRPGRHTTVVPGVCVFMLWFAGVVLRGECILWFVVLMLVIQGGGFILWFEGVLDKVRDGMYFWMRVSRNIPPY